MSFPVYVVRWGDFIATPCNTIEGARSVVEVYTKINKDYDNLDNYPITIWLRSEEELDLNEFMGYE